MLDTEEKMDTFKNEFQVYSPKLYLMAIVVGVSIVVSFFMNSFLGVNTESEVWRRTSIQAIYEANQATIANQKQAQAQKRVSEVLKLLETDLRALNDPKVDEVFDKYFKGK